MSYIITNYEIFFGAEKMQINPNNVMEILMSKFSSHISTAEQINLCLPSPETSIIMNIGTRTMQSELKTIPVALHIFVGFPADCILIKAVDNYYRWSVTFPGGRLPGGGTTGDPIPSPDIPPRY